MELLCTECTFLRHIWSSLKIRNYFVVQFNIITFPPKISWRPVFAITEFESTLLGERGIGCEVQIYQKKDRLRDPAL